VEQSMPTCPKSKSGRDAAGEHPVLAEEVIHVFHTGQCALHHLGAGHRELAGRLFLGLLYFRPVKRECRKKQEPSTLRLKRANG
jgi:hypothetical protein